VTCALAPGQELFGSFRSQEGFAVAAFLMRVLVFEVERKGERR
jgi:hypothetical protein